MNEDKLHSLSKQTTQYWYQDGLTEILMSLVSFLLAVYFLLELLLPEGSFLHIILIIIFISLILISSRLINNMISRLKEKITYPRTGYVSYRIPSKKQKNLWIISSSLVIAAILLIVVLFAFYQGSFPWIPAVTGCLLGVFTILFIAPRTGALRFYFLGIGSIFLGIGISLLGFENLLGLFIFYLFASIGLLFSGILTLVKYIRGNPLPLGKLDE